MTFPILLINQKYSYQHCFLILLVAVCKVKSAEGDSFRRFRSFSYTAAAVVKTKDDKECQQS